MKRAQGDRKAALQPTRRPSRSTASGPKPTRTTRSAQQDVTVDLDRIADTKLEAGDASGALAAFEEALAIRRELAKVNPNDEELQRAIEVSLGKVSDVKRDAGDAAGALAADQESWPSRGGCSSRIRAIPSRCATLPSRSSGWAASSSAPGTWPARLPPTRKA